jgi:AcrR family transcriptional regulator
MRSVSEIAVGDDPPGERKRTGRSPGSPPNRAAILAAARVEFSQRGYEGATIRRIARAAGVDAALVHHYFGTKDELLQAALQPADEDRLTQLLAGAREGLGERLLRSILTEWDAEVGTGTRTLIALVRSASTNEDAARLLRTSFASGGILQLVERLAVSQPILRAALVVSELIGVVSARFVLRIEPISSADLESLIAWCAPTLQRYLTERLPEDPA